MKNFVFILLSLFFINSYAEERDMERLNLRFDAAVRNGKFYTVNELFQLGARTPDALLVAVQTNYASTFKIVKYLVENGYDVNYIDKESNSILMHSAHNLDVVKYLIERGADPTIVNNRCETLLIKIAKDTYRDYNPEVFEFVLSKLSVDDINIKDNNYGDSALFHAVSNDYERQKYVNLLIAYGADIRSVNNYNGTLLMNLVRSSKYLELIEYLLDGLIYTDINAKDFFGRTALMIAISNPKEYRSIERIEIVEALLRNGADYRICDKSGESAITIAVKNKDIDMINLLISYGLTPLEVITTAQKLNFDDLVKRIKY